MRSQYKSVQGGIISISQNGSRGSNGICKSINGKSSGKVMALQSLSINLPRLAYQSNDDDSAIVFQLISCWYAMDVVRGQRHSLLKNVNFAIRPTCHLYSDVKT
jgi:hypothetical protein